jgi:catalase
MTPLHTVIIVPNDYLLPINKAIAPINNKYRDGYMQPLLFEGASMSSPNGIGGLQEANFQQTLPYTGSGGQIAGSGNIGRCAASYDCASRARTSQETLNIYAQQRTTDAYRFELGHVSNPNVT